MSFFPETLDLSDVAKSWVRRLPGHVTPPVKQFSPQHPQNLQKDAHRLMMREIL